MSARCKLLIVIPTLDQSGAEKQFCLLAQLLPKDEFDVRVVALDRGGYYEKVLFQAQIPVDVLGKRRKFDSMAMLALRSTISSWQPHVVLSALFSANAYVRLATTGLATQPAIIVSERCVDSWKSNWQLKLDWFLQSRANFVVVNSQSVADFYKQHGIASEKIRVIPNAVSEPSHPKITRSELCELASIPQSSKIMMYVGRLAKQKRIHDLLWASQMLHQATPEAYFLVVGDGPEKQALHVAAEDLEVTEQVRFLGHRDDAAELLHHADAFWLGSEFEGMSNSLMEAMACGKPVVVSDIPPNRELVTHNVTGWLVEPGDSLAFSQYGTRIVSNPDEALSIGEAARQLMLNNYSQSQLVNSYRQLILDAQQQQLPTRRFDENYSNK